MRLENIVALTYGKLINDPFVKDYEHIVFDASKVKRGDLFIAFDESTIEEAIFNGAYAILFDRPAQITDNEIAWIKVDSVKDAATRLLRFRLIELEPDVYECNEITLKLALQIMTESTFVVANGDITEVFELLWHVEPKSTLLFCPSMCDEEIFTNIKAMPKSGMKPVNVVEKTLFETSFIYDDVFYERQMISPFFIPYLEELLHLLKNTNTNFVLRKFTPIDHFEAVFTTRNFEPKEFGTSDKVLIFEKSTQLIESQKEFLERYASWAKTITVLPKSAGFEGENCLYYTKDHEIVPLLKEASFHFALIVGVDKTILDKPLRTSAQLTLF